VWQWGLLRARGEMGRWFGRDSMDGDFGAQREYALAVENYARLEQPTRDVYEGFAAGVNRYIELHPQEFPAGFTPSFTGYDVAARDVTSASQASARRFLARVAPATNMNRRAGPAAASPEPSNEGVDPIEEGSNAWAFAPSRTKSGRAILLRNPHLAWSSGYYEGHITVPGVMDFYGDFRIGGPFGVVGGFNKDLGWSTTNNAPDLDEIYALDVDPARADHYLFDGTSLPLQRELTTVTYKNGNGLSTETRETWRTPLGPVIWRDGGKIYVFRGADEGDYRGGEQFLHMMRAKSRAEWKDAMRIRSRFNSNFTYADRAGNIYYVWNASIPSLPHPSGGDTAAIPVRRTSDVWTRYVDFDSLPQLVESQGRVRTELERSAISHESASGARPVEVSGELPGAQARPAHADGPDADRSAAEAQPRGRDRAQALESHAARRSREGRSHRCREGIEPRRGNRQRSRYAREVGQRDEPHEQGRRGVRELVAHLHTGGGRRLDVRRAVERLETGNDSARTQGSRARGPCLRSGGFRNHQAVRRRRHRVG
jgi:acyl-homoserine lactone acylase PvdQ